MAYLKTSVIDFTNRINENTSLEDYFTFDLKGVLEFVENYKDDHFDWYLMTDDDKLERIALELYGNANYWDILLLINGKDALFDMPYNFNTISELGSNLADKYAEHISTFLTLSDAHIAEMATIYEEKYRRENESNRLLKIVRPEYMQTFIQRAYEEGYFV
jgi:hypothetical protein